MTTNTTPKAQTPEDISRLFVELANKQDAEGLSLLYEEDAVLAFPPGSETRGRAAIKKLLEQFVAAAPEVKPEDALPTIHCGELALTSTVPSDNTGGRTQIVRRQADGSWLRVVDRPELRSAT